MNELGTTPDAGTPPSGDPTAGAEAGVGSAGASPAGTATAIAPTPPIAPVTPPVKTYTQDEVNSFVQERLQRDRGQWATLSQRYEQEIQRMRQAQQSGNAPAEAQSTQELQWIKETMEEMVLDRELNKLSTKFVDAKGHDNDIMQIAVDHNVGLEAAYKLWRYESLPNIDLKQIEQGAIDRYVASVTSKGAGTPSLEGAGGTAPTANNKHDGSFEAASKRATERLKIKEVT